MKTIIEVQYQNYTENVIVTEDNLKKVRKMITNLVWSYVIEGEVIVEKVQKGLITKYNNATRLAMKIERQIEMNLGSKWDGKRQNLLDSRLDKAYGLYETLESQMNKATLEALENC